MRDYMSHGHGDRVNEVQDRCNAAKHSADSQLFILMQLLTRRNSMRDSSARQNSARQSGRESSSGARHSTADGVLDDGCTTPPSGRSNPSRSIPASFSPASRELPQRSPMGAEQQNAIESLRGLCNLFLELPSSLQVAAVARLVACPRLTLAWLTQSLLPNLVRTAYCSRRAASLARGALARFALHAKPWSLVHRPRPCSLRAPVPPARLVPLVSRRATRTRRRRRSSARCSSKRRRCASRSPPSPRPTLSPTSPRASWSP